MRIQNLSAADALLSLRSRREGLLSSEATARLAEYGKNVIEKRARKSTLRNILQELFHFFALILWLASSICFLTAFAYSQPEMNALGFAILGVIVINAIFSFWQSLKAERALEALEKLLPQRCSVCRNNLWTVLPTDELVPGDIVEVKEGDTLAADVRLIESHRIRVDTSHITGESLPAFRNASPDSRDELFFAKNIVLAGMRIVSGRAIGITFATGTRTEFGKIAKLTLSSPPKSSPLQNEIKLVSRRIASLALILGLFFFLLGEWAGLSTSSALLFAIGIIVANVPEGLMPTLTLSLALAAQRMSKQNALIRRLPAVETLGSTTIICTDKTGTLTLNHLKVKEIDAVGEQWQADLIMKSNYISVQQKIFLRAMRLTHSLPEDTVNDTTVGDPIEIALVRFAQQFDLSLSGVRRIAEIPFDDTRRRQSIVVEINQESWILVKGAPEVLIALSVFETSENDSTAEGSSRRKAMLDRANHYAQRGLKVLGFAQKKITTEYVSFLEKLDEVKSADDSFIGNENRTEDQSQRLESNLEFLGLVALEDPLRSEVPLAVQQCQRAGLKVIIITGDHPETARYVAIESGIFRNPKSEVILGHQLEHWNMPQLQFALEQPEIAFARVKANQKLKIVQALQEKKEIVAVTGDGVNDAPALRAADIGIAMGKCGTDVARESADIVLLDDNFASIVAAIKEGRGIFRNIRNFITYILTSNVPEAIPFILFMLFPIPLPLTILQILAIDLGTDIVPAIGLGAEPPEEVLMFQPPRPRYEHLINTKLVLKAYCWFGLWESLAAMASFFFVLFSGGWTWGQTLSAQSTLVKQSTTATLSAVVLMQSVTVFLCRESSTRRPHRLIFWGLIAEILFLISINTFPFSQHILQTQRVPWKVFGIAFLFMTSMFFAEKIRLRAFRKNI